MAIHASDYTMQELKFVINAIEKMEEYETPAPTYLNAEIIALVATRSFDDRDLHKYCQKNLKEAQGKSLFKKEFAIRTLLISNVFLKYIQLYPGYLEHKNGIAYNDDIMYSMRSIIGIENMEPYKTIIKTTKKNTLLNPRYSFSMLGIVKKGLQKAEKPKSSLMNLVAVKNKENHFNMPETSRPKISQLSKPIHPTIAIFDETTNLYAVTNLSTPRDLSYNKAIASKLPLFEKSSLVIIGQKEKKLSKESTEKTKETIETNITNRTLTEIILPQDYNPIFIDANLDWKDPFLKEYRAHLYRPSTLIEPDTALLRNSFLNSNCTKKQGIDAITISLEHYRLLSETAVSQKQKVQALIEVEITEQVLQYRKANLEFFVGNDADPFVQIYIDNLRYINDNMKHELSRSNKNIVKNMQQSLGDIHQMHEKHASERHMLNHKLIPLVEKNNLLS